MVLDAKLLSRFDVPRRERFYGAMQPARSVKNGPHSSGIVLQPLP